jgi:hypothetical protein
MTSNVNFFLFKVLLKPGDRQETPAFSTLDCNNTIGMAWHHRPQTPTISWKTYEIK